MVSLKLKEETYGLRMDLYAMEQIEDEFGSMTKLFELLKEGKTKTIRSLFRILANTELAYKGKEETVTGDELKHIKLGGLAQIGNALRAAIEDGMKSETTRGEEADDEVYDCYLEEIEKNVETGGQPASVSTTDTH